MNDDKIREAFEEIKKLIKAKEIITESKNTTFTAKETVNREIEYYFSVIESTMQSQQEEIGRLIEVISDAVGIFKDIDRSLDDMAESENRQELQGYVIEMRKEINSICEEMEAVK